MQLVKSRNYDGFSLPSRDVIDRFSQTRVIFSRPESAVYQTSVVIGEVASYQAAHFVTVTVDGDRMCGSCIFDCRTIAGIGAAALNRLCDCVFG